MGPNVVFGVPLLLILGPFCLIRNKLAIGRIISDQPADYILKTTSLFQLWLPLGKEKDNALAAATLSKLKLIHSINR